MEFTFASRKLHKQLMDEKLLQKKFGPKTAGKLKLRLSVMQQARCLDDIPKVPPDRCHQLTETRDEQFAVVLHDNLRLVFRVDHDPIPRKEDGGIDLAKVTRVEICEVVDYHKR